MAFSLLKLGFFIVCVCVCNIKSTIHPSGWLWMMMMMLTMVWTMSPPRQFFLVKKKNNHPYTIEFFFLNPCVLDKSFFFWLEFKKMGILYSHTTHKKTMCDCDVSMWMDTPEFLVVLCSSKSNIQAIHSCFISIQ